MKNSIVFAALAVLISACAGTATTAPVTDRSTDDLSLAGVQLEVHQPPQ